MREVAPRRHQVAGEGRQVIIFVDLYFWLTSSLFLVYQFKNKEFLLQ